LERLNQSKHHVSCLFDIDLVDLRFLRSFFKYLMTDRRQLVIVNKNLEMKSSIILDGRPQEACVESQQDQFLDVDRANECPVAGEVRLRGSGGWRPKTGTRCGGGTTYGALPLHG
jgi:hypothetical protein